MTTFEADEYNVFALVALKNEGHKTFSQIFFLHKNRVKVIINDSVGILINRYKSQKFDSGQAEDKLEYLDARKPHHHAHVSDGFCSKNSQYGDDSW